MKWCWSMFMQVSRISSNSCEVNTLKSGSVKMFTAHQQGASGPNSRWTKHTHCDWRSEQRKCCFLPPTVLTTTLKVASLQAQRHGRYVATYSRPPYTNTRNVGSVVSLWLIVRQKAPHPCDSLEQEYWNGLPLPTPGDHPDSGVNQGLLRLLHVGRQRLYH